MIVVVSIAIPLIVASFVIFGVAVARSTDLPKIAGIGLAVSIVLFAVIGFSFDNWIQSVASALMLVCSVWIVVALRQPAASGISIAPAVSSVIRMFSRGRALLIAWSSVALTVACGPLASLVISHAQPGSLGIAAELRTPFPWVGILAFSIVGALIVSRHPLHSVGWIFCLSGFSTAASTVTEASVELGRMVPGVLPAFHSSPRSPMAHLSPASWR